jgi:uncharacterized protein (DUF924 family)
MPTAEEIVFDWFGELSTQGLAAKERSHRWWKKDPSFDAYLKERYGAKVAAAQGGALDAWGDAPGSALALILLLDQFTRNICRGSAEMYLADEKAQRIVCGLLDQGQDQKLVPQQRMFLYMPLMHAEDRNLQDRSVRLFKALAQEPTAPGSSERLGMTNFAISHRDIVARFGRFPHRNAILGRSTTDEEAEFLEQPGSSF